MDRLAVYRFGDYEVDARLRQVRRAGVPLETQPKTFELLLYLITHCDRVVTKDELLTCLWPGVVVSESALTQAVRKARALVGDDGDRQAIIRTAPRQGLRFIAELAQPADERAEPVEPSIAVLSFVDLSPQRDQEYFCDGMAEEVTNELTRIRGLRVISRTSAFAFKNGQCDVRDIGDRLGVTTVLEGSVRKSGERLRVTAQLVDARTGFHLWSGRWDRALEDMFAIQDDIARRIAEALRRPLNGHRESGDSLSAEDLYQRGLGYLHRASVRSQRFAMDLFHQALALDPRYAGAWAGLALSHVRLYRPTETAKHHREQALEAAGKAIVLDATCAEAWTAQGAALAASGDLAAADAAFAQALEWGPDLFEAHYHFGAACFSAGRYEQAVALYERAAKLRPDDYQALAFAAQAYRALGRDDDARRTAQRQLIAADRALLADPTDARALSLSVCALITLDRLSDARTRMARCCALEPDEPYVHYNAACAHARLGETDEALAALERIGSQLCSGEWMEHDNDLDPIRQHPRFKALLAAM